MQINPFNSQLRVNPKSDFSSKEGNLSSKKVIIYLAGQVPKNNQCFDDRFHWTTNHMDELQKRLSQLNIILLNPAFNDSNPSDQEHVFGRDMHYVLSSDVVFVDARDKRGLGVGAEMMIAKINKIPVISWSPLGTHYNKTLQQGSSTTHFLHPFVEALSDSIVETIEDGANWIDHFMRNPGSMVIKDSRTVQDAIKRYKLS